MNNQKLQELIYNRLYAAAMYDLLSKFAPNEDVKTILLSFKSDANNHALYLERYYQELNTSSYNPIIEEPIIIGSFDQTILWMQEYESNSYRLFIEESYNNENETAVQQRLNYIACISNNHISILTNIYLKK